MVEKMKNAFNTLGEKIGVSGTAAAIGALVLCVAVIVLIAFVIVKCAKKGKSATMGEENAENVTESPVTEKTEATEETAEAYDEEKDEETEEKATIAAETIQTEDVSAKQENPVKQTTTASAEQKKAAKQKKPQENPREKTAEEKAAKRMAGKWRVVEKGNGAYISALFASNGEVMLTSEIYSTEEGARNGIATIIRGVETGNFVIYRDKGGDYYYKLKNAGNRLLCVGEIYKTKDGCEKAAETVKRIAKISPVSADLYEGDRFIDYTPAQVIAPTKKNQMGKWRVEQSENGGFSAKLYANNGQLMLATEEVSARKTAEKAIDAVRKNCAEGNFFIDKDKFGRFYYKLHNAQRSVICTGETYDTVDGVVSAIESVRRFASNAELSE